MVKILALKYCLYTHIKIDDKLREKNENDKLVYWENKLFLQEIDRLRQQRNEEENSGYANQSHLPGT